MAGIALLLGPGELPDNKSSAHEHFIGLSFGPPTMVAAFGWALLQHGLPEELCFRGLLLVLVAVVTLGVSFMLGWLRMRDANRSLLPPIVAHSLANGIALTAAMLAG